MVGWIRSQVRETAGIVLIDRSRGLLCLLFAARQVHWYCFWRAEPATPLESVSPGFGRDLYLTVVFVDDDVVGDMQTQSRAGARSLRSKEGFENAPLDLGGNTGPVVDDLDYDVAVFWCR